MKLATLKNGQRDGELIIVSRDLQRATSAKKICQNLQQALDDWSKYQPELNHLYEKLNNSSCSFFEFDTSLLHAPLPRAYQWADGSAYVTHAELVRKARGAELPESFWTDPLMYQGGSDNFIGPNDPIVIEDESWGIDFEAEIVIITNDVPMAVTPKDSNQYILLLGLVNDISLRNLIPSEIAKSFGFFHSKPASAFSPVFVTPDELGKSWENSKLNLPLRSTLNDHLFGEPNAGIDMTFNFAQLIAHAAKTRNLVAGTIIGSGTVANKNEQCGSSCIAEKRMREKLKSGAATTPFMSFSDKIKIEMLDHEQLSIFGAIEQRVQPYINMQRNH